MILVDFDKLSQLCTFISTAATGVENTMNKLKRERDNFIFSPQEASSIIGIAKAENSMAAALKEGDKIVRQCEELISFIRDEITRYETRENQLVQLANMIKFGASPSDEVDYVLQKAAIGMECAAASVTELPLELDQSLETSSDDERDDEISLDKVISWGEEEKDKLFTEAKEDAKYLKNKAEDEMEKLKSIADKIDKDLSPQIEKIKVEMETLKKEFGQAINDKNLKNVAVDLGMTAVNFYNERKPEAYDVSSKAENYYRNKLGHDFQKFTHGTYTRFENDHPNEVNELKTTVAQGKKWWNNFEAEHPHIAWYIKSEVTGYKAVGEGSLNVVKGVVEAPFDIYHLVNEQKSNFVKNPVATLKSWGKTIDHVESVINPSWPKTEENQEFTKKFYKSIGTYIDKSFIHVNNYDRVKNTTELIGNIALCFTGGGELKAAGNASKAKDMLEAEETVENVSKASNVAKDAEILEEGNKISKLDEASKLVDNVKGVFSEAAEDLKKLLNGNLFSEELDPVLEGFGREISKIEDAEGKTALNSFMSKIKQALKMDNTSGVEEKTVDDIINKKIEVSSDETKVKSVENRASGEIKTDVNKSGGGKGDIKGAGDGIDNKSTVFDYSSRFEDSLANDFNHGYEVRDTVEKDMILVQFSSDAPNASLRYWTTVDEANGISTVDEYMDKMALSKEWGNRDVVKVARIKAGTRVKHAIGTAKAQPDLIDPRPGNGKQILFSEFDSDWITEVRKFNN